MFENHRLQMFICLFALACSAPSSSAAGGSASNGSAESGQLSSPLGAENYVDARAFFTTDEDIDRWYQLPIGSARSFH